MQNQQSNPLSPNHYNLNIFCDGGSRGNPGPSASAFIVYDPSGALVYEQGFYLGVGTNNQAEYQAVHEALKYLTTHYLSHNPQPTTLNFYLDSELVVKQLTGVYKIKDENLKLKAQEIKNLIFLSSAKINFTYIPREKNSAADKLVNSTLDQLSS